MKNLILFLLIMIKGNSFAQQELKLNDFNSYPGPHPSDLTHEITTGTFDLNAKGDLADTLTWGSLPEGFDVEYLGKSLSLELNSSQDISCQTGKRSYNGRLFSIPTSEWKYGATTCRNLSKEKNKVVYKLILREEIKVEEIGAFNLESQQIISRIQANTFYDLIQISDRLKRLGRVIPEDFHYFSSLVGINSVEHSFDLKKSDFSIKIPGENFYMELSRVQGGVDYRPLLGQKKHFNIDSMKVLCRVGDQSFDLAKYQENNFSLDGVTGDINCHVQYPKKWLKRRISGVIKFQVLLTNQAEFKSRFQYVYKNYAKVVSDQRDSKIKNLADAVALSVTRDVKNFYASKSELALMPFSFQKSINAYGKAYHYQIQGVADRQTTDRGDIYFLSFIVTSKLWIAVNERRAEVSLGRKPIKILTKKIINSETEADKFSFTKTLGPINSSKLDFIFEGMSLRTLNDETEMDTINRSYSNYELWTTLNGGLTALVRNQFGLCYRQEKRDQDVVRIYDLGYAFYAASLEEKVESFNLTTPENGDSIPLNVDVKRIDKPFIESESEETASEFKGYRCESMSESSFSREQVIQSLTQAE
ncbi:MAG: hypothetical protein QE271_01370 [Bacteriovoracaceae bacterium]|nr:hypothetical protein [Bacteriovoracaceae bacterium]